MTDRAPFRDCTCYVVDGKITPESRAGCPRHTEVGQVSDHLFDRVMLFPGSGYRETCGVCGGLLKDHPEAPENMRELLRELADALCSGLTAGPALTALLTRLAKYRSP